MHDPDLEARMIRMRDPDLEVRKNRILHGWDYERASALQALGPMARKAAAEEKENE